MVMLIERPKSALDEELRVCSSPLSLTHEESLLFAILLQELSTSFSRR